MTTLAEQIESLTADILSGHEERTGWLNALTAEVGETLGDFHSERMQQFRTDQSQRRVSARALREEVEEACQQFRAERMEQFRADNRERRGSVEMLRREVGDMVGEVRDNLETARRAWQAMAHTLQAPRTRAMSSGAKQASASKPKPRVRRRARRAKGK